MAVGVGLFVYIGIHCADIILTCFLLLYSLLYGTHVEYQEESLKQLNPELYSLEDSGLLNEKMASLISTSGQIRTALKYGLSPFLLERVLHYSVGANHFLMSPHSNR